MVIKPIRNDDDYRLVLQTIDGLMTATADTNEGDKLDVLVTLVEAYERRTYPIDTPDPIEAIKFYMDQNGMVPKDLQPMIGRMNRVYEILSKKRPLTLAMIRNLHARLGIPADCLIGH